MVRVCGKIMIILLPIILVIAGFRLATYGNPTDGHGLFPDFDKLYAFFESSPNGISLVRELIGTVSKSWDTMVINGSSIHDWFSFWEVVGNFFQVVGNAIFLGIVLIGLPFEYLGWFFGQGYALLAY